LFDAKIKAGCAIPWDRLEKYDGKIVFKSIYERRSDSPEVNRDRQEGNEVCSNFAAGAILCGWIGMDM